MLDIILDPTVDSYIIDEERERIKTEIRSFDKETPYYVYFLCFPNGEPFYVGKGKGQRGFAHFNEEAGNRLKLDTIKSIIDAGSYPILFIAEPNLTETEAFQLEEMHISYYGRIGIDPGGILTNILPGGSGFPYTGSQLGGIEAKRRKLGIFSPDYDRSAQTKLNWINGAYEHIDFSTQGKINGKFVVDNQLGIHDPKYEDKRSEWGKTGAKSLHTTLKESDPEKYFEHQSTAGKAGGRSAYENKKGWFDKTEDELFESRSKGGKTNFTNKTGIFSLEAKTKRDEAVKKKLIIEGQVFNSMGEAAKFFNITNGAITYRINSTSDRWINWNYMEKTK